MGRGHKQTEGGEAQAKAAYDESQPLNLGAALRGCDEHDIVRKGTSRKGRYLMVLPLHISLEQGGTMGTFSHMDTAHPKLVIPTADGHLELEGSFVNTTTSYLVCTCQPKKESSTCEHVFNQLLVFGEPVLNTNPSTSSGAHPLVPVEAVDADAAETKEREVAPIAPFYGVSDRPNLKFTKRRSSAAAPQSGKKRQRSFSASSEEDHAIHDSDDDDEEEEDDDEEEAYVEKGFKAASSTAGGTARRQSLRTVKVIDYSALDGSDDEKEEIDDETGDENDNGGEDDEDEDDQKDVDEVVLLEVSSSSDDR